MQRVAPLPENFPSLLANTRSAVACPFAPSADNRSWPWGGCKRTHPKSHSHHYSITVGSEVVSDVVFTLLRVTRNRPQMPPSKVKEAKSRQR